MKSNKFVMKRLVALTLILIMLISMAPAALAETFSAIVASGSMAVYGNAGLSQKLGSLKKDTVVRVTAYSGNVARITYNGMTGYAKASALKRVEDVAEEAVTTRKTLLFQQPKTNSKSVAIKAGLKLYVLKTQGSWAMVERDGYVGYMNVNHLAIKTEKPVVTATPAPAAAKTPEITVKVFQAIVNSDVTVYKSASTSSASLATLKKGTEVTVGAYSENGWAYIRLNGKYGFCKAANLTPKSAAAATATPTPAPTATPTPAPTATPSTANAISATVIVSALPVYKAASISSAKIGTIYKGQKINVLARSGEWVFVELNGKYGYTAFRGLAKTSDLAATPAPTATVAPTATPSLVNAIKGTVIVNALPVFKSASTASAKLGTLKKGMEVNVIKYNTTWAYIELGGKYGFTAVKGLTKTSNLNATPAPTATPSLENAFKATVTDAAMPVYKTASAASTLIGTLKKGVEVNVVATAGEWALIELGGKYGFAKISAMTKSSELNKLPGGFAAGGFTATVVYPGAKAYASPSADAAGVAINLGATVNVYAYSSDWACIVSGDNYAFIPIKHLSRTEYPTVNANGDALQTVLKALLSYGYYDAMPSTSYNTNAINAIKRFQAACGLSQTGQADETMLRILFSGYAPADGILSREMSKGATGTNVGRMQMRLYYLGYLTKTGSVDSDYGSTTANAVKLFQAANGISATGTATAATLKALYSTGAKPLPSGVPSADSGSSSSSSGGTNYYSKMPAGTGSTTSSYYAGMSNAEKLEYVIYVGQNQLGKDYVYGAEGPNVYDCSGFTQYCFKQIGIKLKRSAYQQGYDETYPKISAISSLKRGDLVFFNTVSDGNSDLSDHAGIYLGGGYFIHASSGKDEVIVSNLLSGYYNRVYSWGRRALG